MPRQEVSFLSKKHQETAAGQYAENKRNSNEHAAPLLGMGGALHPAARFIGLWSEQPQPEKSRLRTALCSNQRRTGVNLKSSWVEQEIQACQMLQNKKEDEGMQCPLWMIHSTPLPILQKRKLK